MDQSIIKQLNLIPINVLNAVLTTHGALPEPAKSGAIAEVGLLIQNGKTTLDQVRATKPLAVASAGGIPDELRQAIVGAVGASNTAVEDVKALREAIDRQLDSTLQLQSKVDRDFTSLTQRLNSKFDAIKAPDVKELQSAISAEVSKLFDTFRTTTPVERIVEVANAVPSLERKPVKDVFDGVLSYEVDGEVIDFSNNLIEVWSDPNAPQRVDDYVFNPQHLHQALTALDSNLPDNVWLAGERGTGKTEFVTQLASRLGRRLFRINFDEAMERSEFIGGNTIENGNVVWKAGVLTQAIQHTGAIILLDEVGFARAQNIAVLHGVCEPSPHRSLVIPETGAKIKVASHVVFFGADNSNGHGDSSGNFAGVRDQNTAFLDRFGFTLRFEYLPHADEVALVSKRTGLPVDASEVLVKFANVAREKARAGILTQPPSLRQLFAWARAVQRGVPVAVGFENAIVNKFPAECESELRGVFSATIDVANLKSFLTK